jgi:hypothetical protein
VTPGRDQHEDEELAWGRESVLAEDGEGVAVSRMHWKASVPGGTRACGPWQWAELQRDFRGCLPAAFAVCCLPAGTVLRGGRNGRGGNPFPLRGLADHCVW